MLHTCFYIDRRTSSFRAQGAFASCVSTKVASNCYPGIATGGPQRSVCSLGRVLFIGQRLGSVTLNYHTRERDPGLTDSRLSPSPPFVCPLVVPTPCATCGTAAFPGGTAKRTHQAAITIAISATRTTGRLPSRVPSATPLLPRWETRGSAGRAAASLRNVTGNIRLAAAAAVPLAFRGRDPLLAELGRPCPKVVWAGRTCVSRPRAQAVGNRLRR